jgi:hypothetical protein
MDDLTNISNEENKKSLLKHSFTLVINDFYYKDSAIELKKELSAKGDFNNMYVKKINDKKYRLLLGPFKNFSALKSTYISLNNLGFENLNIYNE